MSNRYQREKGRGPERERQRSTRPERRKQRKSIKPEEKTEREENDHRRRQRGRQRKIEKAEKKECRQESFGFKHSFINLKPNTHLSMYRLQTDNYPHNFITIHYYTTTHDLSPLLKQIQRKYKLNTIEIQSKYIKYSKKYSWNTNTRWASKPHIWTHKTGVPPVLIGTPITCTCSDILITHITKCIILMFKFSRNIMNKPWILFIRNLFI